MTDLQKRAMLLLIWLSCITASFLWIDRPVALLVHDELEGYRAVFDVAARLPKVLGPIVVAYTVIVGVWVIVGQRMTEIQTVIVISALSWTISDVPENWLKFAFGRTWPETWVQDNPSLIRDSVDNFNPFHGGPGFAAFPSGHMVATCAIISVYWICWPRFRPAFLICIAIPFLGLLGANYHFVSDLLAGSLLGTLVGWTIVTLWNAGIRPVGDTSALVPKNPPSKRASGATVVNRAPDR
jgi:membrane-associated phospholipid phosphatase